MAATPFYETPATGYVVPTAVQVKDQVTFVLTDVVTADAAVIVTHNMAMSAADLAAGFPIVVLQPLRASARGAEWLVGSAALPGATGKTANAIQLSKVNTAGSDTGSAVAQIRVHLLRPHTIGR